jgi:hypothetical protein
MNISGKECGGEARRAGLSAFGFMATRVVLPTVDREIVCVPAAPPGMP